MTRIEKIIVKIRDSLSDDGDRWSTDQLLRLIDEAQKSICVNSNVLRERVSIPLIKGRSTYRLPDELATASRVVYNSCNIPIKTHLELDKIDCSWEDRSGTTLKAVIFEKTDKNYIKVYPIPTVESEMSGDFGFLFLIEDYTFDSDFGVILNLIDDNGVPFIFKSDYGTVISTSNISPSLIVYYYRTSSDITSVTDTLEIPSLYDNAIKYFVLWQAFADDMDTQSLNTSTMFFNYYTMELNRARSNSSNDFTTQSQREFGYLSTI